MFRENLELGEKLVELVSLKAKFTWISPQPTSPDQQQGFKFQMTQVLLVTQKVRVKQLKVHVHA